MSEPITLAFWNADTVPLAGFELEFTFVNEYSYLDSGGDLYEFSFSGTLTASATRIAPVFTGSNAPPFDGLEFVVFRASPPPEMQITSPHPTNVRSRMGQEFNRNTGGALTPRFRIPDDTIVATETYTPFEGEPIPVNHNVEVGAFFSPEYTDEIFWVVIALTNGVFNFAINNAGVFELTNILDTLTTTNPITIWNLGGGLGNTVTRTESQPDDETDKIFQTWGVSYTWEIIET